MVITNEAALFHWPLADAGAAENQRVGKTRRRSIYSADRHATDTTYHQPASQSDSTQLKAGKYRRVTDGQTDGIGVAYTCIRAIAYMLSRVKTITLHVGLSILWEFLIYKTTSDRVYCATNANNYYDTTI